MIFPFFGVPTVLKRYGVINGVDIEEVGVFEVLREGRL
jgi:hypothetical protein